MGLNRDVKALKAEAQTKADVLLYSCNQNGLRVMILETLRSQDVQEAYYSQGRSPLEEVNAKRLKAGLWAIGEAENKRVITWTLKSKHLEGKAIDIVPITPEGKTWWNAPADVWEKLGVLGEKAGFKWGGRWKTKDSPHFEVQ